MEFCFCKTPKLKILRIFSILPSFGDHAALSKIVAETLFSFGDKGIRTPDIQLAKLAL